MSKKLKVALVHEFLTQLGGGERILFEFSKMFPDAKIYTLIYDPSKIGKDLIDPERIIASPLQNFPMSQKKYKWYLPLMDWATEKLTLPSDLDLILSDSSAFAKGVIAPKNVPHLCYLHTPTRYLWSSGEDYVREASIPIFIKPLLSLVLKKLKKWDYIAAQRPNEYIANSENINQRLKKYYDRTAKAVIFPFVDLSLFKISSKIENYALSLGRIEPYKRFDLAIEACILAKIPLKVVGSGSCLENLKEKYSNNKNIQFLGRVPEADLPDLYSKAKVFIFPQDEDAGITPIEAMASGTPVLAYSKGGALESVKQGITGEFFTKQTVKSLASALTKYDWESYNRKAIRKHASNFDVNKFRQQILTVIMQFIENYNFQHQYIKK